MIAIVVTASRATERAGPLAGAVIATPPSPCNYVDIFYHIATPGIAAKAKKVPIYKERRFSDLAPLAIDYDI